MEDLVYQIIWVNFYYNSSVVKWYLDNIPWSEKLNSQDLIKKVVDDLEINRRTALSGINSLLNTLESNRAFRRIGIGYIVKEGKNRFLVKTGANTIHPYTILYLLYKFAFKSGRFKFTLKEICKPEANWGNAYRLFGVSKDFIEDTLRWLNENHRDKIKVDIVADLDNIFLNEKITSLVDLLEDFRYYGTGLKYAT